MTFTFENLKSIFGLIHYYLEEDITTFSEKGRNA